MSETSLPETGDRLDRATGVFVAHRELLFGVVYNVLGSVADTEDVLQETWLSWTARGGGGQPEEVANPRAYLVRVAVNHALRRRATITRRQETYIGPWLPEPLVSTGEGADETALRAESVSLALLVVLESLSPLERAVFVLHDVFGYPHTEIADILDRTPAAVRQLARRARAHVHDRRPAYEAHPRVRREATERFVRAALGGDIAALMEILAPDVTVWSDGGGNRRPAGLRPVHGRDKVARLLTGHVNRHGIGDLEVRFRQVNGDAAAVLFQGAEPFAVMVVDLTPEGDRVSGVYIVSNPEKLTRVERGDAEEEGPRS